MNWRNHFDWMDSGLEYVPEVMRDDFLSAIMGIDFDTGNGTEHGEWLALSGSRTLPMMPGMGIQSMINELPIPRPSAVCYSTWRGPYSLLGVRGSFRKPGTDPENRHTVEVFAIDYGTGLAVVCCRVFEDLIPDGSLVPVERGVG